MSIYEDDELELDDEELLAAGDDVDDEFSLDDEPSFDDE